MAQKAKDLVKEKGILTTPNPKLGHPLAPKTADLVCGFYESDDVSRIMPGKKDFASVKQGEQRVHIQKRLVLSNLREVYQLFKDRFPTLGSQNLLTFDPSIAFWLELVVSIQFVFVPSIRM